MSFEDFLRSQANAPSDALAPPGDFGAFLTKIKGEQHSQVVDTAKAVTTANANAGITPDVAGQAIQTGRELGVPQAAVEADPATFKAQAEAKGNNKILSTNPVLARWIAANPAASRIAQDDYANMGGIENVLKEWKGPEPTFGSVASGLLKSPVQGFKAMSAGLSAEVADLFDSFGLLKSDEVAARERIRKLAQLSGDSANTTPEFESATGRAVYGGAASTLRMAPALAASIATRSSIPLLAAAGVQTQGESYAKYRGRGGEAGESFLGASGEGAVEVATELLPMGFLAKQLGRTGMKEFFVGMLAREIPGEQAATLLQDAIDTAVANPDKTWAEYRAERPGAAYETLVSTLTQSAIMGGAHAVANKVAGGEAKAQQAEATAAQIEVLNQLSEASKLRERDAATFSDYVSQVADETGDAPTELFINGAELMNSLNQSGVTQAELEAIAPVVAAQMEAAAAGGDVRIPVSEFLAAGEELTAPLIDHLRTEADGMSRAEAQEFMKTQGDQIKEDVERELQNREDIDAYRQSIETVSQGFEAELASTNRFKPAVNRAYSELLANFYGATAARLGMTPEQLLEKYQLRVTSQLTKNKDRTYNQVPVSTSTVTDKQGQVFDVSISRETFGADRSESAVFAELRDPKTGERRGFVDFAVLPDGTLAAENAKVASSFQKRGLAEAMYKAVREAGFDIAPGRVQTEAGEKMVSSLQSKGLINKERRTLNQDKSDPLAQIHFDPEGIANSPSVISLLAGANLSSFIHESGHMFLEIQSDLAIRIQQQISGGATVSTAERGVVEDMNKLLGWFGIKGSESLTPLDEWSLMTFAEREKSHEKFARGFEAYTMEGNAPSLGLQEVFNKFRSWLVQVYKTLRGLNVDLTDDVRAVMGRMLASDFAIEEAEAARNMGPLFQDAESAGMTLEEYQDYQATSQAATAQAASELQVRSMKDMKWLSRAKDKALKAKQDQVESLRKEIRDEVRAEVMTEPVYQAWQFLTSKSEDATEAGKLRTDELRDMYGEGEDALWRHLSAQRMTSDTIGRSPETVAQDFGFDSGDALVQSLVAALPPKEVIEARTDQRMLETYGDISSPQALERAADEAVHNELRARVLASEMKALQAANSVKEKRGKGTIDVMARAAKEYAGQIVARLRVRDIRPNQYAVAETRNARLAEKALAAGERQEAWLHKRNQLINNYATKAAYSAQDEVAKAVAYFRKFDKRIKSIDAEYQDQIEGLLERFSFKPLSNKEVDRQKSFSAWVEEQKAAGNEPSVPDELLNEANRKSYKDMTVEEIRGLRETIEQVEHIGRLKNKLLLTKDKREFDAIAAEIAASIIQHGGKARPVQLEGSNAAVDWFEGVAAQHRKLASLIRQMDGGKDDGPLYQFLGRGMNERGTMEDVMVEQATVALSDLYAPILKMKGGVSGARSKVFIPEINASLTRGGRLAVALNWGNEANRQRVMDGDKWSERQVAAILKTLSKEELQFVNNVWEYLDSYWPEIAAKEKRLTGVEPERVQAQPFTAVAADGTAVQMRGGYYPLKYDTDRSDRAATQEAAQAAQEMMQGAITKATTRRGHTKERVKEVKRAVRKDLNVITQHVTQVTHDLAWHEWLIDTNKLLNDESIVEAIRAHYGPKVLKTMRDGVLGIATGGTAPQTDIDKAMLLLRSNVTRATMGASLTTAFLQPFGLTQSIVRIGPKYVLQGMSRWAGDATRMENTVSWIRGKSEFMRLRAKTFNRELREIKGAVEGKSETMKIIDAGLFVMMQKMQMVADVPTWIGQYEKSKAGGLDEESAVAMADRAVLESQGGGATKDLAEVQRKHPMLTQFYSYFSVTLNLAAESTAKTDFKNPAAVAGWLGDMALLMVIPAILPSLIMFALKGGDDDDEKSMARRIAEWQVGYLLGTVVGLRELSGAVGGFDYAGPPVGRVIAGVGKFGKQALQGEIDEPLVTAAIDLMGSAFGIPTVQALRSYKGWKAWDEGESGPQADLFGPPPKD